MPINATRWRHMCYHISRFINPTLVLFTTLTDFKRSRPLRPLKSLKCKKRFSRVYMCCAHAGFADAAAYYLHDVQHGKRCQHGPGCDHELYQVAEATACPHSSGCISWQKQICTCWKGSSIASKHGCRKCPKRHYKQGGH